MFHKHNVCCLVVVFILSIAQSSKSVATPSLISVWGDIYPSSTSDNLSCQLCHANSGGGSPWNEYGIDIMQIFYAGGCANIVEAIETAENFDADDDGIDSIDEINANTQPGWAAGAVNSFYTRTTNNCNLMIDEMPISSNNPPPTPPVENDPIPEEIEVGALNVEFYQVADGFDSPVKAVTAPGISGSLFVVEQTGRIYRVDLTTGQKTLFANLRSRLVCTSNCGERGLLGLAFHPDFINNGLFYTYQSEPVRASQVADFPFLEPVELELVDHRSMIVEYRVTDPSCNSAVIKQQDLMIIDQPQGNHNGGDLAFGQDGYLYISLGDGGSSNDAGSGHGALGNGQDIDNPLGAILRIDVDGNNAVNTRYGIPPDNPFVGSNGLDEIFAYGLRNPYRMSFDRNTGELYVGDVGQQDIEEINLVTKGGDYGWKWKEGSFYFFVDGGVGQVSTEIPAGTPPQLDAIDPIAEYDHDEGVSAIGGYVYRGSNIPALQNHYIFGDYFRTGGLDGLRRLMYLDLSEVDFTIREFTTVLNDAVLGFGEDSEGELYVLTGSGQLLKIMAPSTAYLPPLADAEPAICPSSEDICFPIITTQGSASVICL